MKSEYHYFAYGLHIYSELELPELLPTVTKSNQDVKIEFCQLNRQMDHFQVKRKDSKISPNKYFTIVEEIAFYVTNGNLIQIDIRNTRKAHIIRSYLYSSVFAALLIQNDYLLLHASVVAQNNQAFAFVARSGRGKSTTASYFLDKGYHLLTDDICAIKINDSIPHVYSAFPSIKLWEATIEGTEWNNIPLNNKREEKSEKGKYWIDIESQKFLSGSQIPLSGLFFISFNQETDYTISQLENLEAIEYLIKGSFRYGQIEGLGKQKTHFELISKLAQTTPIYRTGRRESNSDIKSFCQFVEKQVEAYKK
jgi:hypothetical protein